MVLSEKKEDRNPGDRLPIGEAKAEIIKYILSQSEAVSTTTIKKCLKDKYGIRNKKNIDNHLIALKSDKCIEKIDPVKNGFENRWNITKKEHLKSIWEKTLEANNKETNTKDGDPFKKINLNKYEKSLKIVLRGFGYDTQSSDYNYRFIQLYMSPSFFNECLKTDIETLVSRAWDLFQYADGFKNENLIRELLTELNSKYIKDNLDFEMPESSFRNVMEKLSQKRKKIYEDCFWLIYGVHTEDEKKRFQYLCNVDNFDQSFECDIQNSLNIPGWFKEDPSFWIESFNTNLKEYVPELSDTSIGKEQIKEDKLKDMYLKLEKLLSLMEKQRDDFHYARFNVLFEYFFFKDIMSGTISEDKLEEEIAFAQNAKKIITDLFESLKENTEERRKTKNKEDKVKIIQEIQKKRELAFKKHENEVTKMIQDFKDKYHMPSN